MDGATYLICSPADSRALPVRPMTVAELRALVHQGQLRLDDNLQPSDDDFRAPAAAFASLELDVRPPARHTPEKLELPAELAGLNGERCARLRWWWRSGERVRGPLSWSQLTQELAKRQRDDAQVALVAGASWFPAAELQRAGWLEDGNDGAQIAVSDDEGARPAHNEASLGPLGSLRERRCAICLERVPITARDCKSCGEPLAAPSLPPLSARPPSIPDLPPEAGWLRMHWRPLLTMAAMGTFIGSGVALRYVAPERYEPPQSMSTPAQAVEPTCDTPCWNGESCEMGRCVWRTPNDVGSLPSMPSVAGPFDLPANMVDVLPLDHERYAVSYMRGVQVTNARTGGVLSLISDAPHAQQLTRVGNVFYVVSPRRIYVVDVGSTRVLKTIELGAKVGSMRVSTNGGRVLASVPGLRAVTVISTDYHAEVSRFFFGDDAVNAVAIDGPGERALTTNGIKPLEGLKAPTSANRYGALYAFDPSRLPSEQDRVRTGLGGNPVDVVTTSDGTTSYVVIREKDEVVRLKHLPSGAVRLTSRLATCDQPEQLRLVPRGRRGIVRCNRGRALEVIDLTNNELIKRIPTNARVSDMALTPDGKQAVVVLPRDGGGAVGLLDLDSYELTLHELSGEPHRVRLSPDGKVATVISDRSKAVWVLR